LYNLYTLKEGKTGTVGGEGQYQWEGGVWRVNEEGEGGQIWWMYFAYMYENKSYSNKERERGETV
jgi:hypothetical protein